ncbi:MAG: hypothetical protein QM765_03535 [Myxococcales bacterium]
MITLMALAALASGAVGCASTLDGLAPFPCAQDSTCPDGFDCVSDSCVVTGAGTPDGGTVVKRQCEYHSDCNEGARQGVCVGLTNGGSACGVKCSGITNGCPGQDCKLIMSGVQGEYDLVPACTSAGSIRENGSCFGVETCYYGLTCAPEKYNNDSYVCTEICTPFKNSCANTNKHCTYAMSGFPADWGLCYQ